METISRAAENITHEFCNILAGIQLHTEVIGRAQNRKVREDSLDEIRNGCEKAVALINQIREFHYDTHPAGSIFSADRLMD